MDCKIKNTIQCEDSIVISEDETSIPLKKEKKYRKSKKCERKVQLNSVGKNTEKLVITQKVQVKKQNIKCVINLNTNVYENKKNKCKIKQQKPESIVPKTRPNGIQLNLTERILPTCGRKACQSFVNIKKKPHKKREIKDKIKREISSRSIRKRKKETCRCKKSKNSKRKHQSASKPFKHLILPKDGNLNETLSLSSISLSPFKTSEISYEDISLDSLSNYSETNLDTLIKRAKERDRQNSFSGQPLYCSTPDDIIEISDDELLVIDEKSTSTSIHSDATLVLEPQLNHNTAYSTKISHDAVESYGFSNQFQEKYCNKYCKNIQTKKTDYVDYHQNIATSNFLFSDVKNTLPYCYDDNINNNYLKAVKNENIANIKSFKSESDKCKNLIIQIKPLSK